MKPKEMEFLDALPSNLPETVLTSKQKDEIDRLYYFYIGHTIDSREMRRPLYKDEMKEKWWGSNSRVTQHQAKRMILSNLMEANKRGDLTDKQAADRFYDLLNYRETYLRLLSHLYQRKG